jgi:hypothetical protein
MTESILNALLAKEEDKYYGEYRPESFDPTDDQLSTIDIIYGQLGSLFPLDSDGDEVMFPINKEWLKDQRNWRQLLSFYKGLNGLFEAHGLRRFNLLPLCSFKSRCITLDRRTLGQLYGITDRDEQSAKLWSYFLHLSRVHLDGKVDPRPEVK